MVAITVLRPCYSLYDYGRKCVATTMLCRGHAVQPLTCCVIFLCCSSYRSHLTLQQVNEPGVTHVTAAQTPLR